MIALIIRALDPLEVIALEVSMTCHERSSIHSRASKGQQAATALWTLLAYAIIHGEINRRFETSLELLHPPHSKLIELDHRPEVLDRQPPHHLLAVQRKVWVIRYNQPVPESRERHLGSHCAKLSEVLGEVRSRAQGQEIGRASCRARVSDEGG